jgi:DNA-binding XRE family transcriptional regulator
MYTMEDTAVTVIEDRMAVHIKARPNFGSTIARAGLTRPELAQAAGVSARTLDALANPGVYSRSGSTREATAWKIARGFAQLMKLTPDEAFAQLFIEEVETESEETDAQ